MNLSQVYGNSAIGTSPAVNKKQKTNLAVAIGVMGKGSSRTLSIEWACGSDAQPDINNPIMVIEAWLRFVDSGQLSPNALRKAWHRCYRDTQRVVDQAPETAWQGVTSAMSATILHLIQLHIQTNRAYSLEAR